MNVQQSWGFDRPDELNEDGERPLRVTVQTQIGAIVSMQSIVLNEEAAAAFEADLARVLHGGLEIARVLPESNGGTHA